MWRRGWSGANPSVVSPRGKGGGNHGSTALSGSRGSHGGGGRSSGGAAATGGASVGAAAAGAAALEPPARGGEERRTRGRKALPLRVFTIQKLEKEKKGGGGLQKLEMGCEMKRKERKRALYREGGGGGGGGGGAQMKGHGQLMALSAY